MARGIWKNSLLKILLTRTFLGELFRPLLYSPEEHIHYTFLESMNTITAPILSLQDFKSRGLAYLWIFDVPRTIFEEVFFTDDEHQAAAYSIDFVKETDGREPAYLTQGYVWYYIEYLLKINDSVISPYIKDLRNLAEFLTAAFATESKIAYYRDHFTRLSAVSAEGTVQEEAARLYITETIRHLTDTKNTDFPCSFMPDFIQTTSRKCIWKLENAKYTTVTMLNCWK